MLLRSRLPVPGGLLDLLRSIADSGSGIQETMKLGDMYIHDWSLFQRREPLLRRTAASLEAVTLELLRGAAPAPVRGLDTLASWFHVNRKGSAFAKHNHTKEANDDLRYWSLVYYVDPGDARSGHLRFIDPADTVVPEAGMVLLFPSHREHVVAPYLGETDRVMIGCNYRAVTETTSTSN